MRGLIESSLRLRHLVVALALGVFWLGASKLEDLPFDVFPEFAPPMVEVQTEAPGLTAEEVESLISVPLENALNGTAWLQTVRSKSVPGLSSVVLLFEHGTDVLRVRQLVQERLAIVTAQLPRLANPPVMLSPLSATSRAMKIGMSSKTLSLVELSTLARWTVRPRLMAVPGVANVAIWGQRDRQLQVRVDPDRLRAHGVSLGSVLTAAGDAVRPAAGGFVETPNQRLGLRQPQTVKSAADLARAPVKYGSGASLRLGEVAQVVEGHQPMIGDGIINDGPGVLLIVEKQPWGNTLQVTRDVEAALANLKPALAGVAVDPTIFRPATFIEESIDNLTGALWSGCLLVVVVLFLFLYDWRAALISSLTIPLSLIGALLVLYQRGTTINTMILAGLIIALGELVDDAIVDVENVMRRLAQARAEDTGRSAFSVVLAASLEVRGSIVYATLIVVVAMLPIFFMEGLSGAFFRPLAWSYALAVMISMLVALTVTPALCLILLGGEQKSRPRSPLALKLVAGYERLLPGLLVRPRALAIGLGLSCVVAAASVPYFGESFLPAFKERDFLMHWVTKPGTSLPAMDRITIQASRELRAIPGVRNFGAHVGRAEVADEVVGVNFTELWISVDPKVDYMATVARIEEVVAGYPGIYRDLLTYLKERIKEVLSGSSSSLVVRIFGPDLQVLEQQAASVAAALGEIPGVDHLKVEPRVDLPAIAVRPRVDALASLGLGVADVQRAVQTLVAGTKVGEVYDAQKVFDVVVWGVPETHDSPTALAGLLIDTPGGDSVRLGDVADVRIEPTASVVRRESVSRRIDVGCDVTGRDLGAVARDIEARLAKLEFPVGYHPELLGEYRERMAASARLQRYSLLSLLVVFLLLQASFGSFRLAGLAFATLPSALIGGLMAAALGGGVLSLGSLIGFVTVLGITARNGIMMITHFQHLEHEEGMAFGPALVIRGATERLAPILMTAATAGLGLLPLVLRGELPGQEIEHPLAVVILGGLVTSTLLNLAALPALYLWLGRPATAQPGAGVPGPTVLAPGEKPVL